MYWLNKCATWDSALVNENKDWICCLDEFDINVDDAAYTKAPTKISPVLSSCSNNSWSPIIYGASFLGLIITGSLTCSWLLSLANEIGFSVGKINYVLKSLVDKGFIKAERFITSDNKSQYKYLLTEKGMGEKIQLTRKFIFRKKAEYKELQRDLEIDTLNFKGQISDI